MPDNEILKWAITQNGLVFAILVIVWAYRKDLIRVSKKDEENNEILVGIIKEVVIVMQELKAIIKEVKEEITSIKEAMRDRR